MSEKSEIPERKTPPAGPEKFKALEPLWKLLRKLVLLNIAIAAAAIFLMIGVTCANVILSRFGTPIFGADDIVTLASAVAIACSLPYTTAVKGHVAIEFFFQRLGRRGRVVVDTIIRLLGMSLFSMLSWRSFIYGLQLKKVGQVSITLEMPLFWVPQVISFSCALVVLVILYNLLHPGREMIKP